MSEVSSTANTRRQSRDGSPSARASYYMHEGYGRDNGFFNSSFDWSF